MHKSSRWLAALTLGLAAASSFAAGTGTLQCWNDDRGQRACGDTVPPSEARRQREMMNQRGVVQKVLPAQKTPEQAAEDARISDEQKRQEAYDHYLLQTYQNVGELEKVRDERLATLDGRMTMAQKALGDNTKALADLSKREQSAPAEGESLDPTLKRKIREFTQARGENQSAIARIDQERKALTEQFSRDMRRYQLLRDTAKSPVPR